MVRRATVAALGLLLLLAAMLPAAAGAAPLARHFVTSFGNFPNPRSIAVDQSNGDVYVLDAGLKSISRFDKNLVAKKFTGLGINVIDGVASMLCSPPVVSVNCDQTPFNGFSFDLGGGAQLAIDNSGSPLTNGDIYVTDSLHRVVDVFAPSGVYLGQLTKTAAAGTALGAVFGVAVDPTGALYVADSLNRVRKLVPSTNPPTNADFGVAFTSTQPAGLATGAGATAGSLFVSKRSGTVSKLDSSGVLQYELSSAVGQAVAVDPSSGHVYVATGAEVVEYDASGAAPTAVGAFGSPQVTTATGVAVDGSSGRAYVADATTGKVYVYAAPAAVDPPVVALTPYTPRLATSATLAGTVDAVGVGSSSYYFEYGAAPCATSSCASAPPGHDGTLAKGSGPLRAAQTIAGLQPDTTYHYRLVATNAAGTSFSPDATFTTLSPGLGGSCPNAELRGEQGAGSLPDCRAYELVSAFPASGRNEIEVLLNTERVRAAADGSAFQFTSLGGTDETQGLPVSTEFMGVRNPVTGWRPHGLTPMQASGQLLAAFVGREPAFRGEFTPDLNRAVFLSASLLNAEGPNVKSIYNLYRRDDMLTAGAGSYRLLSDAVTPQTPWRPAEPIGEDNDWLKFIGGSADLSHVVFEAYRNLTADAATLPEGMKTYEWADGTLRLVGVLPSSEGGGLTLARAGQTYYNYTPHVVSADGSRIAFTAPPYGNGEASGRLYVRDDHGTPGPGDDTSVKISASEKTNGAGAGGADARGALAASYADASVDMDTVFFRSAEALTNDAPEDLAVKLYRYRFGAPAGARLTLLSVDQNPADGVNDGVDGTIGVSSDGSYVYFVSSNQLVADRPPGEGPKIFVWHQGSIRQVGPINAGVELNRIAGIGSEPWQAGGRWARVSPDGEHLTFVTEGGGDLAGYDHGSKCASGASSRCKEIYLYSAPAAPGGERLQCASCPVLGATAEGDADFNERDISTFFSSAIVGSTYLNHALTPDGRFVFFTSGDALSPGDENDKPDAYEFDSTTGRVSLLSGGRPAAASYFLDASVDGSDAFILTRSQLLDRDGNDVTDVYDARVGGGFAEPAAPAPACESTSACRPAVAAAPATPEPKSLQSPAAVRPRVNHKRHHRAKKHKARHRGHKRGAKHG